jgi:hypothetical protein
LTETRSIRERFPPPWRVEQIPGGYRVTDAHGRPLAYVYGVDGSARAALPEALTPAEALALARAIVRLPEIMPAPCAGCYRHGNASLKASSATSWNSS